MDISGFQDVFEASAFMQLDEELNIKIVTLPGLAALKIFASDDRGKENNKDSHDLRIIIEYYLDAGNSRRLFNDFPGVISDNFDYIKAGAWLLGKNIQSIISTGTHGKLFAFSRILIY